MSTTILSRHPDEAHVQVGDHVRDELHLYTVDEVWDHLVDLDAYVLRVHDENGTPFTLLGSEVVRCGRHERETRLADVGRQLRAAGYRTRVAQNTPGRLIAQLVRGSLHAFVCVTVRRIGVRAVGLYRYRPPRPAELLTFEFSTPRGELFTVTDLISRAVALADEVKATVR